MRLCLQEGIYANNVDGIVVFSRTHQEPDPDFYVCVFRMLMPEDGSIELFIYECFPNGDPTGRYDRAVRFSDGKVVLKSEEPVYFHKDPELWEEEFEFWFRKAFEGTGILPSREGVLSWMENRNEN